MFPNSSATPTHRNTKMMMKFLPTLLIAILLPLITACGTDETVIAGTELPSEARAFIATYYPETSIAVSTREKRSGDIEYDVTLSNGHKIVFNAAGVWTEVDAAKGHVIPSGFYPDGINAYVSDLGIVMGISEISKEAAGYEVTLTSGAELIFSYDGDFLGYDIH